MFGRLKDWRRVDIRYDRCPKVFLSAIALAALVMDPDPRAKKRSGHQIDDRVSDPSRQAVGIQCKIGIVKEALPSCLRVVI